ncbi:MAG: HAD-IIB family hydrolase [Gammaproteobacteria bacterium]|nr:phosphoglycolate phosphatase [Gammaproteobacteria bacterium]
MRYLALCTDYDGTIAHHGRVDAETIAALQSLRESGRKLVLVTGRVIPELESLFPRFDLFDVIVAENGALLHFPATQEQRLLAEPPPERFVQRLRERGVEPLLAGRCIVATWHPHEHTVLDTIRDLGLELRVIFNKGAVMILPAGTTKASGVQIALRELNLSVRNAVGVGDAENDHVFLRICECSAAVANALPSVKEKVDIVLEADHGAGVRELIRHMLENDLAQHGPPLSRRGVLLGRDERDEPVYLSPYSVDALIVGTSGGGKSSVATGLIERLHDKGYNFCIIDPEGDYDSLEIGVVLGGPDHAPTLDECAQLLCKPETNAIINLLGIKLDDRPWFFRALLPRIRGIRARTGRPHWLLIDEAHHLLPAHWQGTDVPSPDALAGTVMISVRPSLIAPAALRQLDTLVVLGEAPNEMLREFTDANRIPPVASATTTLASGHALVWSKSTQGAPKVVRLEPSRTERKRHLRKYAEGRLPEQRCFYFRGPEGKLRLRATNLMLFMDIADGVDDETWLYHLRRGDVSRWLREGIRDEVLAEEVAAIEQRPDVDPDEARRGIRELIEARYTLPAV